MVTTGEIYQVLVLAGPLLALLLVAWALRRYQRNGSLIVRLNIVAALGAPLGVLAALGMGSSNGSGGFEILGVILMIVASCFTILSPLAGTGQMTVVILDLLWAFQRHDYLETNWGHPMGIAVAVAVIISMIVPIGIGYDRKAMRTSHRLLTLSISRRPERTPSASV
jgi:4-amino-4-deoxy-L-arabinose transferase-like glycosyltransferase